MLFPDKIPFVYKKSWNNTIYGYIDESNMKETIGVRLHYEDGYINDNTLILPAKLSNEHINFSLGSINKETFRWIYNYTQKCNKTTIPIYMVTDKGKTLIGAVLPCGYMQCQTTTVNVHDYAKIPDCGGYVEVYKSQLFPNVPMTSLGCCIDMYHDYYSGVLYVNGKPVLSSYLQSEMILDGWFCRVLASNLVEAYVCYYAQSLLEDDEVLLVEFKKKEKEFIFSGVSVGNLKVRKVGYCTPILESIRMLRQPFILLGTREVIVNIPQGDNGIAIEGSMESYAFRREGKLKDNLEKCIFSMAESIDKKKFFNSEIPYTQIMGYNKIVKFPDTSFAGKLLVNL